MKSLLIATTAALALAATGCKSVKVTAPEWSMSYLSILQSNDVKGLKGKAPGVEFELEQTKSGVDPAAGEMLKTAAEMLRKCADACETCATCAPAAAAL